MVAGNWKMYKTSGEGAVLIQDVADVVQDAWDQVEVVVCPPSTGLKAASTVIELDRLSLGLGAQDVFWEEEGAYTGAIAPRILRRHERDREQEGPRAVPPRDQADHVLRRVARHVRGWGDRRLRAHPGPRRPRGPHGRTGLRARDRLRAHPVS